MSNPPPDQPLQARLNTLLDQIYGTDMARDLVPRITDLIAESKVADDGAPQWVDETDVVLITYGDSMTDPPRPPLEILDGFLRSRIGDIISNVHILPCYPWSSDDGFSVVDYRAINPALGGWTDIARLAERSGLMLDAVINHTSSRSNWFRGFLAGDPQYRHHFHVCDPVLDYSAVTRPRTLPLLTPVETVQGECHVWTTFSDDQIDLNYANPDVLIEILGLLLFYAGQGARFIRLDAIGFLWKEIGTSCIHLPQTHALIQVMRLVLDAAMPGVILITETNVPHAENISYFGDGTNEAHMVYQFPLPPLTLHAFQSGNAQALTDWAAALDPATDTTAYLNFLSSHDGIGVRPVEGILGPDEVTALANRVEANGGRVSYRNLPDGSRTPYELNITFLDAVTDPEDSDAVRAKKFLAAQTVLLSLAGVPAIYIHSLLGSRNDTAGLEKTGHNRSINRTRLSLAELTADLDDPNSLRSMILEGHRVRLAVRRTRPAFRPSAAQRILTFDTRLFSLLREGHGDRVLALINVSDEDVSLRLETARLGFGDTVILADLLSAAEPRATAGHVDITVPAYATAWYVEKGQRPIGI